MSLQDKADAILRCAGGQPERQPGWRLALICSDGWDPTILEKWEHISVHAAQNYALALKMIDGLQRERDEARAHARILAHAYTTDTRPPYATVQAALAYPVDARDKEHGL